MKDNYIDGTIAELEKILPDGYTVRYDVISKNNNVARDGIMINDGNKAGVSPIIYITEDDRRCLSETQLAEKIWNIYQREKIPSVPIDIEKIRNPEWVKERLVFEIVNEKNGINRPHMPVAVDVIACLKVEVAENAYIRITNDNKSIMGDNLDEHQLFEIAINNSKQRDEATFASMNDIMIDIAVEQYKKFNPEATTDEIDDYVSTLPIIGEDTMYVLSTKNHSNRSIMYEDKMQEIYEAFGEPMVIIFSSTEESLVIPYSIARDMGIENIMKMPQEVNSSDVIDDEIVVSDEVVVYDGENMMPIAEYEKAEQSHNK